jgi:ribose 5-phosphate isomerase B
MKIIVAADHHGFYLKQQIIEYLKSLNYIVEDAGDRQYNRQDDFPVFATQAIVKMLSANEKDTRAILICGSGQGMMMAANRFKGVRAGLGYNIESARGIRNDEDSNVLALPAEILKSQNKWQPVIDTWLTTPFANAARYIRRNRELDEI